jgi:peptidoglycan/LPS O-acetylase OafA/YrhL
VTTTAAPAEPAVAGEGVVEQSGELRVASIESIRALAALAVLVGHVSYTLPLAAPLVLERGLEGGLLGVDVFFVLTGYLLFWPFARALFGTGDRIDLRRYALNRAVRILPLYYFVLAVLLVVQHDGGSFTQWWRFGLFAMNFWDDTLQTVNSPMWSLAVEIHFYLLLPLLAWLVARAARGRLRAAVAIVAGLGAASLVLWQVVVVEDPGSPRQWEFSLPARFWLFSAGMLLALTRLAWLDRRPAWLHGWRAKPAAWWLTALPLWALAIWRKELELLVAPAAFLMVGAFVLLARAPDPVTRALESRPLTRLGVASYSLYMWHIPIVLALMNASLTNETLPPPGSDAPLLFTVGIVLPCLVALVSYALVEAPFLRLRRRWAPGTAARTPA